MVKALIGPVKLTFLPRPPKEKKEKKKKQPKKTKEPAQEENLPKPPQPPAPAKEKKPKQKGGSILDFLPLVEAVVEFLGDFRRKLRLDDLYLRLILAGDDPCDLAVNYGRAWAALGNLLPRLERVLVIKKRDLNIECDFEGSETLITARVQITITLGRLLGLAAVYGFKGVKTLIPILNKRKGGNVK